MEAAPAAGAKVGVPQPLVVAFGEVATTMFPGVVGNVSVKATFGNASLGLGLVIVKVNVLVLPGITGLGLNTFSIEGGRTATRLALAEPVAVELVPLSVVEI